MVPVVERAIGQHAGLRHRDTERLVDRVAAVALGEAIDRAVALGAREAGAAVLWRRRERESLVVDHAALPAGAGGALGVVADRVGTIDEREAIAFALPHAHRAVRGE